MINLKKYNPKNLKDWYGNVFQKGDLVLVSYEKEYKYKDKTLGTTIVKRVVTCQPWFYYGALNLVQFDEKGYLIYGIPLYRSEDKHKLEKRYNIKNVDIKIIARNATRD